MGSTGNIGAAPLLIHQDGQWGDQEDVLVVWEVEVNHGEELDEMPWPPYRHRAKRQWDMTLGTILGVILSLTVIFFLLILFSVLILGVWQLFLWLWGMTF